MDSGSTSPRPERSDAVTDLGAKAGQLETSGQARYLRGSSKSLVKGKTPAEERRNPSTNPSGPGSREKPLAVSVPARTENEHT
jgi:hypothetical protein